ncbi:MAG: glycoside hydrolase family 3 C-terminal domain-containing protein [Eubacteriales bacterium]|nr:glycoside hydrolase family 3 C-terminal domain-containing protein [Eubacteriales bacterium]
MMRNRDLPESYETEGCDREDIRMPENQNRLISEIGKVQKNTVVVLHGGACMALPWFDQVKAVLCMHLGGDQVGRAVVELLYGAVNPSGKLAETWPLKVEDNTSWLNFPGENGIVEYREGIYIGYRYYDKKAMEVRFPFGYGLSYTTFSYQDLKLDKESMTDKEQLMVSFKVKNTGNCFGKEVVQLYIRVKDSTVRRPVRELKGFEKIALEPGEEKEVRFVLDAKAFA